MIKKQQKWIALLVTLTFVWLLQVSTMPALAADSAAQIGAANAEQGPHFIEEEEGGVYKAKKSSVLPIILIGVGVVALAAVLFLVVLKTKYDITGEWQIMRTRTDITASPSTRYLTFSGDKKAGTVRIDFNTWGSSDPDAGIYSVDGKAVSFTQYWPDYPDDYEYNYVGNFTDKDTMNGTFYMNFPAGDTEAGSWTATRRTPSTAPKQTAAKTEDKSRDAKRKSQR